MDMEELKQKIIDVVQKSWTVDQLPLLLSRMGSVEGGIIGREVRKEGLSLMRYIEKHLMRDVRIIRHSTNSTIVGVVPIDTDTKTINNFDPILEKTFGSDAAKDQVIRFHYKFWFGFKRPMNDGFKRFVIPGPPFRVEDIHRDSPLPNG
ncbi:MAG TPA: hypothetical protein ENI79_01000, partial [Rhodospirillales bacterium]|nr:hypothetical protein [Rhodospirillales bacterium]